MSARFTQALKAAGAATAFILGVAFMVATIAVAGKLWGPAAGVIVFAVDVVLMVFVVVLVIPDSP